MDKKQHKACWYEWPCSKQPFNNFPVKFLFQIQSGRRVFPGSGALWEVFSLQSTGCFLSRQAMRNFCRVLISQIKCIKRWCWQPSLTQIRLCTAKPLQAATDQCNWQPKVAAESSSLLRRRWTMCRCRTSLLPMSHQPEAPQPGPQFPDPHPPVLSW